MAPVVVLDEHYYALTAIVTVGFQLAGFVVAYTCQFDKVTDFSGAANFILIAALSLGLSGTEHPRAIVLTAGLIVSRAWLGGFLLYRVLSRGADARFDEMRAKCCAFFGFWVFQMLWVWLVSLPVVFVNSLGNSQPELGGLDYAGFVLYGVGLLFEVGGDLQKLLFKSSPDSRGRHPSSGLYAVMRHPNYTGEMLIWIGTFLSASAAFGGQEAAGWVTVLSPVFTVLILLFLSGMPSAEGDAQLKYMKTPAKAEEYRRYRSRTSPIVPCPPQLYGALPLVLKRVFCCEWPMYEVSSDPEDSDTEVSSLRKAPPPDSQALPAASAPSASGGSAARRQDATSTGDADITNPVPGSGYQASP